MRTTPSTAFVLIAALAAVGLLCATLSAQPTHRRASPAAATPAQLPSSSLGAGWAALDERRFSQALAAADAALAAFPRNHSAATLKTAALAGSGQVAAAFEFVRAFDGGRLNDDRHLVGVIAEVVLRGLGAAAAEPGVRVRALATLASAGDRPSRDALAKIGSAGGTQNAEMLASLGDESASHAIVQTIRTASGSRQADAIAAAGRVKAPGAASTIQPLLASDDPAIRAAAADALGELGAAEASDALVPLLSDQMPAVRRGAAVALRRLGRPEGDVVIASMLGSGVPDVVLGIAEGLPDDVSRWQDEVAPLLKTENPVDRLRAARLLKNVLPEASSAVVQQALSDGNVAVREEASRALSDLGVGPNPQWPTLLQDPSPWVRVEAARALFLDVTK